jgi:SAM-dependent methyltransferase
VTDSPWPEYRCPRCIGAVESDRGALVCGDCGARYAVEDGIPWFVERSTYADAFGAQWLEFASTQLDSRTGLTITADRTERLLGPIWRELDGANVLEVGAGAGRFTEVLLGRGAWVSATDLSRAVEANAANVGARPRHRVAAASALALPFAPRGFELVFAPGMVQHTPSPEATIAALFDHVAPGGWLVFDHYRLDAGSTLRTAPLVRQVVKRLPADRGMAVTDALVRRLLPLHRAAARWRAAELVLNRVSPVTSYFRSLPALDDELQAEWARLDTHDNLTDVYKHHRSAARLERLLRSLGASELAVVPRKLVVEVRARRP